MRVTHIYVVEIGAYVFKDIIVDDRVAVRTMNVLLSWAVLDASGDAFGGWISGQIHFADSLDVSARVTFSFM
jgi:hypothetical protein